MGTVVNISTDKAADPVSVLGHSKRTTERLTAGIQPPNEGRYLSVRFGNVLGSRGSMLTAFRAQIANGGPVTVTHREVTRYFMTVKEAVHLVLQAATIGRNAETLILDMGQPVRIADVASHMIEKSGRDIEIVYTGLRDGEKMHEVLSSEQESGSRPLHPLVTHVQVPPLEVMALEEDWAHSCDAPWLRFDFTVPAGGWSAPCSGASPRVHCTSSRGMSASSTVAATASAPSTRSPEWSSRPAS
ncbi:MAG: polysaccharide biosynthesis protein [Candidatus Nanopelagicales bacterium]